MANPPEKTNDLQKNFVNYSFVFEGWLDDFSSSNLLIFFRRAIESTVKVNRKWGSLKYLYKSLFLCIW